MYNDFDRNLVNLFHCMKERTMATIRELGFCNLNSREDFIAIRRFLEHEQFSDDYLSEELHLTEIMVPPPDAKELQELRKRITLDHDVRRAAMFLKLLRYSYSSSGKSFASQPFDIRRLFGLIQELEDRMANVIIENQDFETLIKHYHNPKIEEQLTELADLLSKTSGKKQYGYLKPEAKAIVNRIVMELSEDERIAKLYDLWYEQAEEIRRTYTSEMPKRIPLVDNKEFTSVKNAVINEALNLLAGHYVVEELSDDDDEPEPVTTDYESTDPPHEPTEYDRLLFKAQTGNKRSQYALAKLLLDHESEYFNPDKAVEWLIESAQHNYTVAKYKLGKIFLKGEDVPKDVEYALRWLEEAVEDENSYAEYLLGKTYLNGTDVEQDLLYAEDLLRLSIQHGNKYAKYALGKELLSGDRITQNIPEGLELLKESAGAGFSAAQYLYGKLLYKGELLPKDIDRAIAHIESAAEQDNPYASYLAGKIRLTEDTVRDIQKAIKHFEIAAESGNHYAEYQLGKIYLYGKDVPRDYDKGMEYLRASAEHGNQYAEQLIHSIESNRNWSSAMGSIRLLHHLSRMLQQQMEERDKAKFGQIDRKLKRKIDEKKEAQGLRQG